MITITESKSGIYVSHVLCGANFHTSYHTDGQRHMKDQGKMLGEPFQGTPINDIKGLVQVIHVSMSLSLPQLTSDAAYEGDEKTESVLMLHEHQLSGAQQRFGLDVWVFDRESESNFYESVCGMRSPGMERLAELVTSLDNFPGHKVALSLRAQAS